MISEKYQDALNELSALAGNVTPGVWQQLRLIRAKFEALLEPIQGMETELEVPEPEGSELRAQGGKHE